LKGRKAWYDQCVTVTAVIHKTNRI